MLGLGLIGGSVMRAATAAGREVFGYNRSIEGVQAATVRRVRRHREPRGGADARRRSRRADRAGRAGACAADRCSGTSATPRPGLPADRRHQREDRACSTRSIRSGLLATFVGGHPMAGTAHSGWAAGDARLFVGAPWVISVDDHVDPDVWAMVMDLALDCGAVVVPARSDEHDAAAAAISHLPHLLAEALAVTAGEVPLAFALAAGSFRDGTRVAATAPDLVRAMCEATPTSCCPPGPDHRLLNDARDALAANGIAGRPGRGGHAARMRYDSFGRPQIVTIVVGADNWREELAAAGRAGGVIRSALPVLGSRG